MMMVKGNTGRAARARVGRVPRRPPRATDAPDGRPYRDAARVETGALDRLVASSIRYCGRLMNSGREFSMEKNGESITRPDFCRAGRRPSSVFGSGRPVRRLCNRIEGRRFGFDVERAVLMSAPRGIAGTQQAESCGTAAFERVKDVSRDSRRTGASLPLDRNWETGIRRRQTAAGFDAS